MKCKTCGIDKPIEDFNHCKVTKSGRHGSCKTCLQYKHRQYRKRVGPEKQRVYLRERRQANKRKIIDYFGGSCTKCGYLGPACVYDLHHVNPDSKDFGIAQYLDRVWDKILPELTKCTLLCSNCHRIVHHDEPN